MIPGAAQGALDTFRKFGGSMGFGREGTRQ